MEKTDETAEEPSKKEEKSKEESQTEEKKTDEGSEKAEPPVRRLDLI